MTLFDRAVLAERVMAVDRHLRRVAERLPDSASDLQPATDASDAVILHLWQATQVAIDLAMAACYALKLGTPGSYAQAFRLLQRANVVDAHMPTRHWTWYGCMMPPATGPPTCGLFLRV